MEHLCGTTRRGVASAQDAVDCPSDVTIRIWWAVTRENVATLLVATRLQGDTGVARVRVR
jgi:hypothetical protein